MGEKGENGFMNKIQQIIPNFQLKITSDCITSKSGLLLFVQLAKQIGLIDLINLYFPKPGSNRGIRAYDYVMSIVLMLLGGGKYLEDIREIKRDTGIQKLCGIKRVPSADAISKWLRQKENAKRIKKLIEYLNTAIIKRSEIKEYTLDVDATLLETEKNEAEMTYKGFRGNSVLLSFLPELDLCIYDEYRDGNAQAGSKVLEQIKYANQFLKGLNRKLKYFRSDSAGYNSKIINYCNEEGIIFSITADMDSSIKSSIKSIKEAEWKPLYDKYGVLTEREYATTVHCMNESKEAFSLIVQRWEEKQGSLFEEYRYHYYVIATNAYDKDPQEIIHFHNQRGNSENYNKELKNGYGLEYVPTHDIKANEVYFKLGILSYTLACALKRLVLGGEWIKKTITTLRWEIIFIAGKIVYHGRQLYLKIKRSYFEFINNFIFKTLITLAPPA